MVNCFRSYRVGAGINGHGQKPDSSDIIGFVRAMTSRNVTEFAMEVGKCKANLHPSFGGIQLCSVDRVAVFLKAIFLFFYMGNDF